MKTTSIGPLSVVIFWWASPSTTVTSESTPACWKFLRAAAARPGSISNVVSRPPVSSPCSLRRRGYTRPPVAGNRRTFLRGLGVAGAGLFLPRRAWAAPSPLFEEVAPAASGISFVHENAMSPERYLPETVGPGCAFIDYDDDGWMDVYLVNSGPCDFY